MEQLDLRVDLNTEDDTPVRAQSMNSSSRAWVLVGAIGEREHALAEWFAGRAGLAVSLDTSGTPLYDTDRHVGR